MLMPALILLGGNSATAWRNFPAGGSAWREDRTHGKNGIADFFLDNLLKQKCIGWLPEVQAGGVWLPDGAGAGQPKQGCEEGGRAVVGWGKRKLMDLKGMSEASGFLKPVN